jgi:prepilin-type N-terminal cleavage/methylation domain-containing protein
MKRLHGMTLTELIIALAITSMVGAGVVAMTDAVARVLDDGRAERDRTIAPPRSGRRVAWRLIWAGEEGIDSTTVVAGALHKHSIPENH